MNWNRIRDNLSPTRLQINKFNEGWMLVWTLFLVVVPLLVVSGLLWKSSLLLENHTLKDVIFSSEWKPMSGKFGFMPFIMSSLWVTLLSLLIAAPICLFSAIHLTQYANRYVLRFMQPVIDILAGIPSVIYGVWGIIAVVPFVAEKIAPLVGVQTTGYNILSASIVLAVMVIPFILNILIDIINTIPKELTEASLSLGAGKWYTIKHVILRKALPGIISAMGLGLSRSFGETIAVLMVVGNVAAIPSGIFQPGYPLPALIANNYGEMMSIPQYDSALMFSALLLMIIVLFFNIGSRFLIMSYEKRFR
ncbi:MAG TPA: phosphate ABC transporter permease subunit PstC [Prolixibacteraceae bacterium]|nr:phosphate ABC transporter permease subunit PstC [Prolixibacteraceae bacterium]